MTDGRLLLVCLELHCEISVDFDEQMLATFKSEILYHDGEAIRHMDGSVYDAEHEDPMPSNDPEP